jgi:hypothetical protein
LMAIHSGRCSVPQLAYSTVLNLADGLELNSASCWDLDSEPHLVKGSVVSLACCWVHC